MSYRIEEKDLKARIDSTKKSAEKLFNAYQILAINCIRHAAAHGDPTLLNRFYQSLKGNLQTGFKLWASQQAAADYAEGTKPSEFWLGMVKGVFIVRKGTADHREHVFVSRIDVMLDLMDGPDDNEDTIAARQFGRFFEKQTDSKDNPNLFNEMVLIKDLHRILKKAEGENSQLGETAVKILRHGIADIEHRLRSPAGAIGTPVEPVAVMH